MKSVPLPCLSNPPFYSANLSVQNPHSLQRGILSYGYFLGYFYDGGQRGPHKSSGNNLA